MHKVEDVASRVKGSGLKPPTQYLGRLGLCLYPKALGTHILRPEISKKIRIPG